MNADKIQEAATAFADENDTDVILYNGAIERPFDSKFIDLCLKSSRRKSVVLFLCTLGGDANAAYRIARCLQQKYEHFSVAICGACKSAGTLLAVGAHEIIMSDHGEMGPLDVQLGKKDEIWETDSGLTVLSAIKTLEEKSFDLFENSFLNLKTRSGGRITLKTATELASKLAIGVISPIVAQIDPMHVGEVSRAMNIGLEYGKRLSDRSKNPNENTIEVLTNSYPSHGFVIDRDEAESLFCNVRQPNDKEAKLIELLGTTVRDPEASPLPLIVYVSKSPKEATNESDNQANTGERPQAEGAGDKRTEEIGSDQGIGQPSKPQIAQLSEKLRGASKSQS